MLITVDYFTKWIEVELLAHITNSKIIDFVWRAIIYLFGIPSGLITDNGRQFIGARFEKFYKEQGILHHFTL